MPVAVFTTSPKKRTDALRLGSTRSPDEYETLAWHGGRVRLHTGQFA